jgi:hypothetical protein
VSSRDGWGTGPVIRPNTPDTVSHPPRRKQAPAPKNIRRRDGKGAEAPPALTSSQYPSPKNVVGFMAQTVALQNRPPDQPVRALQVPTHESERNEIESADPHFGCQRKARNWRFPHTKPHPPSVTAIARLAGAKPQNYQNQKAYFDVISGSWPTILKYTATFYSAWQEFYCIRTNIVLFFFIFSICA